MAVKSPVASTLNPNAPLFVPAAYVATEDFSPEWWSLVQTCPAFRDYWIRERYEGTIDSELTPEDLDELEDAAEFMDQHLEELESMDDLVHQGPKDDGDTNNDMSNNTNDNKELDQQQDLAKAINSLNLNVDKDPPEMSEIS